MIDQQDVQNITNSFSTEYAAFVNSDFARNVAGQFGDRLQFDPNQITALQEGILLYLLTVLSGDELTQYLLQKCVIPESQATLLSTAVQTGVDDIISTGLSVSIEQPLNSKEASTLSAEIAEAEAALQAVPEIRTMAKDIEKTKQAQPEKVYTSSQEVLLKESVRDIPKDESRWGNQT